MEHLSQEELLLLADGELADSRAAHLDACATCCAAAGAMQGQLTAITAQLRASAPAEAPESHSASWLRLENAIRGEGTVLSSHLLPEELLLHLDDELAPERALHLESCESCHDELLRVQAFLFDVEHELRALIPAESRDRRAAAAEALEREIYATKKVVSFPVRWGAVYAAAAALTFAVFGGLWMTQNSTPADEPALVATAEPATAVGASAQRAPAPVAEAATQPPAPIVVPAPRERAQLQRFELVAPETGPAPARDALPSGGSLAIEPVSAGSLDLAWTSPAVPAVQLASAAERTAPAADPETLLAGLSAAVRTGAWAKNVAPELRAGRLVFAGSVDSDRQRDKLIAAVRGELAGRDVAFDIAVHAPSSAHRDPPRSYSLGDRPAGGMMRTALLAHYADAARRSFQQPAPSALEAEIARFASGIYRSQSNLVRHAHALSTLLAEVDPERLSREASKSFAGLVRFHANGVADSEGSIYDHLSEALPRRYWNHRGDRQAPADADTAEAARQLLADALRLDETLTTLLGSPSASVDASEVETSAGALLYRIRTRARNLTSGLDSAR